MPLTNTALRNYDSYVLRLPADKRKAYHAQVDRLVAELNKSLKGRSDIKITRVLKAGSFAKFTILRRTTDDPVDVDLVIYVAGKNVDQETLQELLEDIYKALIAIYPSKSVEDFEIQRKAATVTFAGSGPPADCRHGAPDPMTEKHEVFISVDIEAAGPVPPDFSMLSIGAWPVNGEGDGFYKELKPIGDGFDPGAMKVTGFDLDELRHTGEHPLTVMLDFETWIADIAGGGKPILVGFNAPFDWAFVNYYFHHFLGRNPFGIGGIDIKALYMGATRCKWDETRSSHFPVPPQSPGEKHNALGDAKYQAELFRFVRSLRSDERMPGF